MSGLLGTAFLGTWVVPIYNMIFLWNGVEKIWYFEVRELGDRFSLILSLSLSLSLSHTHTHTHIWAVQDGLIIWRLGGKGLEAKMGSLNVFFRWEATSDRVSPFLFAFELLQVLQHV